MENKLSGQTILGKNQKTLLLANHLASVKHCDYVGTCTTVIRIRLNQCNHDNENVCITSTFSHSHKWTGLRCCTGKVHENRLLKFSNEDVVDMDALPTNDVNAVILHIKVFLDRSINFTDLF